MRIIILGSTGMLGRYMKSYFKHDLITIDRNDFNVLNLNDHDIRDILIQKGAKMGDIVLNCIGDIKQRNYSDDEYYKINTLFPIELSDVCETLGLKMIHFSTDCVFSGDRGNYLEIDKKDANDSYGISKGDGEPKNCMVIRTSIIGEELNNKLGLLEWVKSQEGKEVYGYTNHYWNGVTCLELAKIVEKIIIYRLYWTGVRHFHSPTSVSKYVLINMINSIYRLNIKLIPHETKKLDRRLKSKMDLRNFEIKELYEQIKELRHFRLD